MENRVLWVHPDGSCKKQKLRTWEPEVKLREDDFSEEMGLVNKWKVSTVPLFEDFRRVDNVGMGLLGADEDNPCVFNALKRVAGLLGRPEIITELDIDQFVEDRPMRYNQDLREGSTWIDVRYVVIRLLGVGRDLNYNAFVQNNYMQPGCRGARVLKEVEFDDGVYIVAYNHSHIDHAAELTVQGNKRLIYNLKQGKPIPSAINFYAFIRSSHPF